MSERKPQEAGLFSKLPTSEDRASHLQIEPGRNNAPGSCFRELNMAGDGRTHLQWIFKVNRHICMATVSCFLLISTSLQGADRWVSEDGVFAVTPPKSGNLSRVENPPAPFSALWMSDDELIRLGVVSRAIPARVTLTRASLEEGFVEEIGGTLTKNETKSLNGHEAFLMTATTQLGGRESQISQIVIRHGTIVYKAMAATGIADPEVAVANEFLRSIEVLIPASAVPLIEQAPAGDNGDPLHVFSKRLGGWGVIALIVALAWRSSSRRKRVPTLNERQG